MKKLILILMAAVAFSCGDGNRSSERDEEGLDNDNTEMVEPDTTGGGLESDTTSMQNGEVEDVQKDSIN